MTGELGTGVKTGPCQWGVVTKINGHRSVKINDVDSRLKQLSIIVLFPWLAVATQ